MHDSFGHGKRFRTLHVFDEGVREVLAIEIDSSLTAERVMEIAVPFSEKKRSNSNPPPMDQPQ